jgi:glycerate kinase
VRVVVAPDSFKGSATATEAAAAIVLGWLSVRPGDDMRVLPQADGGEGTLAVIAASVPGAVARSAGPLAGPRGAAVEGIWLELPDGVAVVELATVCGLPLYEPKDPLGASTFAFGELLDAVVRSGAPSILVALGGSASTDGAAGAITALGARLLTASGHAVPLGGGGLRELHTIEWSALRPPPRGGVRLLTDVTSPLLGPLGAAAVFAPQKGASESQVEGLEEGLRQLSCLLGGDPDAPGSGAAGGTAFGLASAWGATIVNGAIAIAELTGLTDELDDADVLVTGEGRFDVTSLAGKVAGHALAAASGSTRRIVIAGQVATSPPNATALSLTEIAGSTTDAMASPLRWLEAAGARAAHESGSLPKKIEVFATKGGTGARQI